MPPAAPYPLLSDVLNAARVKCNDAIGNGVAGQTLTNTQPLTAPLVNTAYQSLQQFLVALGYTTLDASVLISGLPPAFTNDPSVEVSLSWTGYFDGNALNTAFALPQNLIRPLRDGLEQRLTVPAGSPNAVLAAAVMTPMDEQINGPMAHVPNDMWLRQWQWREDAIYMTGALAQNDIRIRYAKYLPDLVPTSPTQVVPIMRSLDALSSYIAVEFSRERGDMDTAALLTDAQNKASILAAGDNVDMKIGKSSERGKMKDRYSREEGAAA